MPEAGGVALMSTAYTYPSDPETAVQLIVALVAVMALAARLVTVLHVIAGAYTTSKSSSQSVLPDMVVAWLADEVALIIMYVGLLVL